MTIPKSDIFSPMLNYIFNKNIERLNSHYNFSGVKKPCAVKEMRVDKEQLNKVIKEIESTLLSQSPFTVVIYGYHSPNDCKKQFFNVQMKIKSFDEFFSYAFGVVHCTHDIHSNSEGALIHRDIKSSNFLVYK
ncbi:hypothetical protein ACTFIU_010289 [Dictyostelium citrinum]